jgi:hypothetical protein
MHQRLPRKRPLKFLDLLFQAQVAICKAASQQFGELVQAAAVAFW